MKINNAYRTLEDLLSKSTGKAEKKSYKQLLGVLDNLKERNLSTDELQAIEEAIDRLEVTKLDKLTVKERRKRSNRYMKEVREILSLLPEDHYMGIALCMGVAFGGLIGSLMQGVAGIPEGTSGTGLGISLGLIAAFIIGHHLDVEAIKQNRVLQTLTR